MYPRVILWIVFGVVVLVGLGLAVCTLAGRASSPRQRWTFFLGVFLCACAAQSGYLAAPFVLGKTGWPLTVTLWLMGPVMLAVLGCFVTPAYLAMTAIRPDGASGWKTVGAIVPSMLICMSIYGVPPLLLILHRAR